MVEFLSQQSYQISLLYIASEYLFAIVVINITLVYFTCIAKLVVNVSILSYPSCLLFYGYLSIDLIFLFYLLYVIKRLYSRSCLNIANCSSSITCTNYYDQITVNYLKAHVSLDHYLL